MKHKILKFTSGSFVLFLIVFLFLFAGIQSSNAPVRKSEVRSFSNREGVDMQDQIIKSDSEWKEILTKEQYRVLRKKGTERPFSGEYVNFKKEGIFRCAACGNPLFSSQTKYNSGTGWPSFWAPISPNNVELKPDNSLFMKRTEVVCSRCGGHLGHVFNDGPPPTHKRFCINSVALQFDAEKATQSDEQK